MASSETQIANLALSHLAVAGTTFEIQDLDTESSKEAAACRAFYAQTRDEVLEDFPWPFATQVNQALALVTDFTTNADDGHEWAYAYQLPTDCLMFRRLLSGTRNDSRESRVPYRIAQQLLYTDLADARGEWTVRITDVTRFSAAFVQALALKLAFYIGPRVAGGDQYKLADRAFALYQRQLAVARANALNAEQPDVEPDSSLIQARD